MNGERSEEGTKYAISRFLIYITRTIVLFPPPFSAVLTPLVSNEGWQDVLDAHPDNRVCRWRVV